METVYIETTIVSLLVSNQSRDVATAAQQQVTRDWWLLRRRAFDCVTSDQALTEASRGNEEQAKLRLEALRGLPVIAITPEIEKLAGEFLRTGCLPATARPDAIHLAAAAVTQIEFLLTWNWRHLANGQILRRLQREAERSGWQLPFVCTPAELMGDFAYDPRSDS
jgi:hypothetical protein